MIKGMEWRLAAQSSHTQTWDVGIEQDEGFSVSWRIYAKWDGCLEVTRYFNAAQPEADNREDDTETLHFCEVSDLEAMAEKLRNIASANQWVEWE